MVEAGRWGTGLFPRIYVILVTLSLVRADVPDIQKTLDQISRQFILQELYMGERTRAEGGSGLMQVRNTNRGSKSYHADSHTGKRLASIHDHANNIRTVGMGEFIAVLNGVEFRTRHNDYKLVMPAKSPAGYNEVENIPFPDVPESVTSKATVEEQMEEMREWFRAWATQNATVRDYTKYFKPILCYLEGGWTESDENSLEEPFESDRHFLDAKSMFDLQEKIRFTSYTGRKDTDENFAFLPTTVMKVVDGVPVLAQWNYRIVCQPLAEDLPLTDLDMVEDLQSRMAFRKNRLDQYLSRAARFKLNPLVNGKRQQRVRRYSALDKLMEQIPGKDGSGAYLEDTGLGESPAKHFNNAGILNAAYYHHIFRGTKDAMGSQVLQRGFADENLYMAMTTQKKVAAAQAERCEKKDKDDCQMYEQRWTYAIPLEILYLTPLHEWNPYGIQYMGDIKSNRLIGPGSDGQTVDTPLNGSAHRVYYHTPRDFYDTLTDDVDQADTSGESLYIRGSDGTAHEMVASGMRIFLPKISGIDRVLRTRFPIMPIHAEGSAVWKELQALTDLVLHYNNYQFMFSDVEDEGADGMYDAYLRVSEHEGVNQHTHNFQLDIEQIDDLLHNKTVSVTTDVSLGHDHNILLLIYNDRILYKNCDNGENWKFCWDQHPRALKASKALKKYVKKRARELQLI